VRVVVDTNVFISSLLNTEGYPRKIIDLWRFEKITLCLSKEILTEYFTVLGRFGMSEEPLHLSRLFRRFPRILPTTSSSNAQLQQAQNTSSRAIGIC
jgi:putative PIN family toxin of toxin-antitoxin system